MENDNICVFCGERLSKFRSTTVQCGTTWQPACKACEKEMKNLPEVELCQRALVRGIAQDAERVRARIALITEAEDHRPQCRCGGKMVFMEEQTLDNSPYRDSVFADFLEVIPAYCTSCGKYDFYRPDIVRRNKHLAYLIHKDTTEE